jgi:predicted RNA binding protein YcfA (HicA-like mRNA interferase family)
VAPTPELPKGALRDAVGKAVAGMTGRFTPSTIVETMKEDGFQFTVKNPNIAVNSVLRTLISKGAVKVAWKGSGRTAHQYERAARSLI